MCKFGSNAHPIFQRYVETIGLEEGMTDTDIALGDYAYIYYVTSL